MRTHLCSPPPASSIRLKSRFATLLLWLLALAAAAPAQAATSLRWTPSALAETLALSEQKTIALTVTAVKPLKSLSIAVSPTLAPYVQVSPTTLGSLAKNGTAPMQVVITAPAQADPNTQVSGSIQVRTGKNNRVLEDSLPITLTFNPQPPNHIPTANAGPDQTIFVNQTVQLDGSGSSDLDGDPLSYLWSFTGKPTGSAAALDDPTRVNPSFLVDRFGDYSLELVVDDGQAHSNPDSVTISTQNSAPVANAGPDQTLFVNETVQLDGGASSDVDGDPLTYAWTLLQRPAGSTATLANPLTVAPSFTLDRPGDYLAQLLVNDGLLDSAPDTVSISTESSKPIANAGPDQSGYVGDTITLDGSGSSDVDGDPLTYDWSLITLPDGSTATLATPTAVQSSFVPDLAGSYVGQLIVNDGVLDSDPDSALVTIEVKPADNHKPQITSTAVTAAVEGQPYSYDVDATDLDVGDSLTYTLNTKPDGMTIDAATGVIQWTPTPAQVGDHGVQVQVQVTDLGGLFDTQDFTLRVTAAPPTNQAPQVEAGANQTLTLPTNNVALNATVTDDGLPNPPAQVSLTWSKHSGPGSVSFGNPNAEDTTASFSAAGSYVLRLTADDGNLSAFDTVSITLNAAPPPDLPPDPGTVAPPLDPTVSTRVAGSTEFLYTGPNPIQTGVAPGTIEERRAAVIRGRVFNRAGSPLPGVTVTLLDHPELGQTLSRTDGAFDLAVNGGGVLTLDYQKPGYLPAQRQVNAPWQDFVTAPDVSLVTLDPEVTPVDLTNPTEIQVARGSPSTDGDGTRRATLLFTPGTSAEMRMPDGSTQPLDNLSVRATEYTLGLGGPRAMPAELPPTSGYTYALEISADQALAAGARSVVLNQPIPFYVENFLGFPVGSVVPVGYYDRDKGQWIASPNGRVIKLLSITGGLADLDTDGDGSPDAPAVLAALGIDDAERAKLAQLYSPGQSLWRVPIDHFTPWDCNWPYGPPAGALPPGGDADGDGKADAGAEPAMPNPREGSCTTKGSVIGCETQTLGEAVPVAGTPFSLHYQSERTPGYQAGRAVNINLTGTTLPPNLKAVKLTIEVAGRRFEQTYPATPNQLVNWTWDGLDAYGRPVAGGQRGTLSVGYVYDAVYYAAPNQWQQSFALASGVPTAITRQGSEIALTQITKVDLGAGNPDGEAVGGWSLSEHHRWDAGRGVLVRGDGTEHRADAFGAVITTVAGNGVRGYSGDGGPATAASLYDPIDVAIGNDGSLYIVDSYNLRIRRVDPDGIITTVAGNGNPYFSGDGGPATAASLASPFAVAVGPDSSLYIGDFYDYRVRRVGPDGIITTVAGNGVLGYSGDGGPATAASLHGPYSVALGPDGSLYIADVNNNRIRRVGPNGIITTIAGDGVRWFAGDGGPATAASLAAPTFVTLAPDGSLYIATEVDNRIRKVNADGIITTVAGSGYGGFSGDGGSATAAYLSWPEGVAIAPDGDFLIADFLNHRVRRVGPDGIITTVAGNGDSEFSGDGGPATAASMAPFRVAVAPDGNIYLVDTANQRVRRVVITSQSLFVPSTNGTEVYEFDLTGCHQRTLDALTGGTLYEFGYDAENRLTTVTDGSGNFTSIERDGAGDSTAIVGPYGQRTELTLDASGYLATISNPAGETYQMQYTADGLLTRFEDPRGNASLMTYDSLGRLTQDANAAGGSQNLTRLDLDDPPGAEVTVTTAEGVATAYKVEDLPIGSQRRTVTAPDGTTTVSVTGTDGKTVRTAADGTVSETVAGPDPRFGMAAPLTTSQTITTPGGKVLNLTQARTADLTNPNNPLSLVSLTDTATRNGRTATRLYTAATRTAVRTSAAGRQSTTTLDELGRPTLTQTAGLEPVAYAYDTRGRLQTLTQGSGLDARTLTLAYAADGTLATLTDALGRSAGFASDLVGRVTGQTFPDGRQVLFDYDANGNLSTLTPPGRPVHAFDYTPVDLTQAYVPPNVGAGSNSTQYSYDLDKQLTQLLRPDGVTLDLTYDSAGRLATLGVPEGDFSYAYQPTTGHLSQISAPDGGTLGFSYDGALLTSAHLGGRNLGECRLRLRQRLPPRRDQGRQRRSHRLCLRPRQPAHPGRRPDPGPQRPERPAHRQRPGHPHRHLGL